MKIRSLHIINFGKFSNRTFHFSDDGFQLVYGLNESGKTTLKAFIESMLFGFSKNKTYKPKQGTFYGGSLTCLDEELGDIHIERTSDRGGQAQVFLSNGEVKDEAFLQTLLKGTDRRLFQSIYSFDVFGLQNVQALNQDQIGEFLLFSSLFGSDAASKMDSRLLKQQEQLFKPNGRKPELNKQLDRLKELTGQLKQARLVEGRYTDKKREHAELTEAAETLQNDMKQTEEQIQQLTEYIRLYPMIENKVELKKELARYPERVKRFRVETEHELDKLESHLHPKMAQMTALKQKLDHLQTSLTQVQPLHDKEALLEMKRVVDEASNAERVKNRLAECKADSDSLKQKIDEAAAKLKWQGSIRLDQIDDSLEFEWELKEAVGQYVRLMDRKAQLDDRFDHARHELEEAETALKGLKEQQTSPHGTVEAGGIRAKEKQAHSRAWLFPVMVMFDAAFLLVLFFLTEWWVTFLFAGFSVFVLFAIYPFLKLTQAKQRSGGETFDSFQVQAASAETLVRQKELLYERIIRQYEDWELELEPVQQQVEEKKRQLGLSSELSFLVEAFLILKQLKTDTAVYEGLRREIDELTGQQSIYEHKVSVLSSHLHKEEETIQDNISAFQEILKDEAKREKERQTLDVSIQHVKQQLTTLEGEIQYYEKQTGALFRQVEAASKEDYQVLSHLSKEYRERLSQLQQLNQELHRSGCFNEEERIVRKGLRLLEEECQEAEQHLQNMQLNAADMEKRLAELAVEIRQIEASGTVSDLTHQLAAEQEHAKHLAKKWAAIQLVRSVIQEKLNEHKETRLPALLQTASSFIQPLTNDRYEAILFSTEDDRLMVKRVDGRIFRPEELSQATCEQIYLAIRFALALSHQKDCQLPFMMDDSFVHFDHVRLGRVLELMNELTRFETQLFYFTCHQHMTQAAEDGQITSLAVD
ncbi:atpase involved in dna metabolism [Bacillus australimaris]|uniref:AAA family ATPase n=1 Tax=Bacillus australimaris TaxID=1326968 RepID=A0ABD4QPF3_9BACI|nr:AAA family ATPase [Bacillus australimaris]KPN13134.1 atpase involved in dna metabolism [Bacillus australimaris]MBR8691072.1 AAA family ATPase [Bacillus australimaris]